MKWSMLWDLSTHNMSVQFDQNWCGKVSACSCDMKPWSKVIIGVVMSLLFLTQFDSALSTDCSTFDTKVLLNACPQSSCSCFSRLVGILGIHSCPGKLCRPTRFFIFIVPHLDIITWRFNWCNVISNWDQIHGQSFRLWASFFC